MKAEGFNWYGESNEDDDEDEEQLAAKEEQAPLDFASILKGETADENDNSQRSIGEIFGISKAEDDEDSEPSTFDKIIGRTLEEDSLEESTEDEAQPTTNASEVAETDEAGHAVSSETHELPTIEAEPPQTIYAKGGHEQPLADLAPSDSEPVASASDTGETNSESDDQQIGQAENISAEPAPEPAPSHEQPAESSESKQPEPVPEAVQTPPQEATEVEPEAEAQPDTQAEIEPAPEPAQAQAETADEPQPEPETDQPADQAEAAPEADPEEESQSPELAEEAERSLKLMIEEDEGPEDPEPPRLRRAAANQNPPDPSGSHSQAEASPQSDKESSPAGMLALLLGVREIFKRRKGDRENRRQQLKGDQETREALEEHELLDKQKKQELASRQEEAQKQIDQLKQSQDAQESFSAADKVETTHDEDAAIANIGRQEQVFTEQQEIDQPVDNDDFGQFEASRPDQEDSFNQELEPNSIEEIEIMDEQRAEIDIEEGAEHARSLNQEADGELALDSRHEATSLNKVPSESLLGLEQSSQQPTHIADVIASSEHAQPAIHSSDSQKTDGSMLSTKNQELKNSIKAGVTVGLIIVVLAAVFLIFK